VALLFLILAAVVVVVPALGLEVLAVAETAVSHLVMFQHLGQPTQAAVVVVVLHHRLLLELRSVHQAALAS